MGMQRDRARRRIIASIILLALAAALLFTPRGGLLARGLNGLRVGVLNLPGIAWARGQLGRGAPPGAEARPASEGSDAIRTLLREGMSLQEQGKPEEALRRYQRALEADRDYPPTYAALASAYMQLEQEDEAVQALEQAAALAPDNGFVLGQLGELYLKRDNYEGSIAVLERAKAAEPEEPRIRSMLGTAYYYRAHADIQNAVLELEQGTRLAASDADIHFRLALAYMQRDEAGDGDRAIQTLKRVLELDPAQAEAYRYLGMLYLRSGRREEAIAAWRRYVEAGEDKETVAQVSEWLRSLEAGQTP